MNEEAFKNADPETRAQITTSTKMREGKKMYCMTAKSSGKEYCYHSEESRKKGMAMHEAYKT